MVTKKILTSIVLSLSLITGVASGEDRPYQNEKGVASGDLQWEVLFTMPICKHPGQKENVWCTYKNYRDSEKANGVVAKLKSWIGDSDVKAVYMAYFSFANSEVIRALCSETSSRHDLQINLFLDVSNVSATEAKIEKADEQLSERVEGYAKGCKNRIKILARAGGHEHYIQHSKIFMATTKPLPTAVSDLQVWTQSAGRVRFNSASANMSATGPTLNFENWLFFDAPSEDYVAQQNVCSMMALMSVEGIGFETERQHFKDYYHSCVGAIQSPPRDDLQYFMVPSTANNQGNGPEEAFKQIIFNSQKSVKVAIHRFTTSVLAWPLIKAKKDGKDVRVIYDDDTLISSVEDVAALPLDMSGVDVKTYYDLRENNVNIRFMETNSDMEGFGSQLMHNKFVVADGKYVFQGAGNFTSRALNTGREDGNYEQFYLIAIPELAKAYEEAYDHMFKLATPRMNHPVGNNREKCIEGWEIVPCGQ